jgi:2-oxoglutarate ferredoxin oxidoreductase subunit gamma
LKYEIILSGKGGQGLILAGIILAEAAAIYEGLHVVQTQSYGPEARGGASKSEVIISDEPIDFPKVTSADIVVALSQEACDIYAKMVKRGGILILDEDEVQKVPEIEGRIYRIPFIRMAVEEIGKAIVTNIVTLGSLIGLTEILSPESVIKAIENRTPKGTEEINRKAFELGFKAAKGLA